MSEVPRALWSISVAQDKWGTIRYALESTHDSACHHRPCDGHRQRCPFLIIAAVHGWLR